MSDSTTDLYKLGIQGPSQPQQESTKMANAMLPECSHCEKPFDPREQGAFMSSQWPSTVFNVRHGCGAEFSVVQLPGIGRPGLNLTNDPPAANVIDAESEEGTEESVEGTEDSGDSGSGDEGESDAATTNESGTDGGSDGSDAGEAAPENQETLGETDDNSGGDSGQA